MKNQIKKHDIIKLSSFEIIRLIAFILLMVFMIYSLGSHLYWNDNDANNARNAFCISKGFNECTDSKYVKAGLLDSDSYTKIECDSKYIFTAYQKPKCKAYDKFHECDKMGVIYFENQYTYVASH